MRPPLLISPGALQILETGPLGPAEFCRRAVDEHHRILTSQRERVFKDAPETAVTLVELPGMPRVCVKEFRWRGTLHACKALARPTQGLRTFFNGRRLVDMGVGAALPLALVTRTRQGLIRKEWVVMETLPAAVELDRYLVRRLREGMDYLKKRELIRLFARFISGLHDKGIFHADLKTCNIMVSEADSDGTVRFYLLDYDDVKFSGSVSLRARTKNLVQIFLSTPLAFTASDRLRFLSEYCFHGDISRSERIPLAKEIIRCASGRKILYVGFDGDIEENWET